MTNGVFNDNDDANEALAEAQAKSLSPVIFFKPGRYVVKIVPDKDATGIKTCYADYQGAYQGKPGGIKHLFPAVLIESDHSKVTANKGVIRYMNLPPLGLASLLTQYARWKKKQPENNLLNTNSYTLILTVATVGNTTNYTFEVDDEKRFDASACIYPSLNVVQQAKAEEDRAFGRNVESPSNETKADEDDDDLPF